MRFLIVKNITREGPGLIQTVLKKRRIAYQIIDLSRKVAGLPHPSSYDALIVMGGPDSANDQTSKIRVLLREITECLHNEKPLLGICLGMQALVKAAGGRVTRSPYKEVGFTGLDKKKFRVTLTAAGKKDPLFRKIPPQFNVFQLHGETTLFHRQAKLLGKGKFCRNQAVKVGRHAYGFQFHCELTPALLRRWLQEDSDLKLLDRRKLEAAFQRIRKSYVKLGTQIFENFVRVVQNQ